MLRNLKHLQAVAAIRISLATLFCLLLCLHVPLAFAQDEDTEDEKLTAEQIEQLVAPIALHPDALMAQILMASTYPLEIVQAARWVEKNPDVTGEALEDAMEKQDWDSSVKSLTAFPQALQMMSDELDWTQKLGDAFLAQQEEVLDAVQRLRERADKAGNLETTEQQTVETKVIKTETQTEKTVYIIEPADPKVVYVPAYNPTVVYGTWPYTAYPPYHWYPPGYVAARAFWFGAGVVVGRALWGGCNWGRGNVNINVNRYNNFNRTNIRNGNWNHNPRHRRAVPYKGRETNRRFSNRQRDTKAREQFRGRADRTRRDLNKPGAKQRPSTQKRQTTRRQQPTTRQKPSTQKRQTTRRQQPTTRQKPSTRKKQTRTQRPNKRQTRQTTPRRNTSSYRNTGRGKQTRQNSNRGRSSRNRGGRRR